MNQDNKKFFWGICFITVIGAIYWSVTSVVQQPSPFITVFLIVNIVSLIVNVVCLIVDIRKNKE